MVKVAQSLPSRFTKLLSCYCDTSEVLMSEYLGTKPIAETMRIKGYAEPLGSVQLSLEARS